MQTDHPAVNLIKCINTLLILLYSFSCFSQQPAINISVLSEEFPPFNYIVEQKPQGIHTQIVQQLLTKLAISQEITFLPWGRAFHIAKSTPNTLIFSIARNESREDQFHWVGLLSLAQVCVFSLKTHAHLKPITSLAQVKNYRIATQQESHMSQLLIKENFIVHQNFLKAVSVEHAIKLLQFDRVDFIGYSKEVLFYHLTKQGLIADELLQTNFCVDSLPLYLAFSLGTPISRVKHFQQAFAELKADLNEQQ